MIEENYNHLLKTISQEVKLVIVSKTQPIEKVETLYHLGHRCFGENKVQELLSKQKILPTDIQWHLIGHLQTNKVKQVLPYVSMIQSVDSLKLVLEIQKEAQKINKIIDCLLEVKIAQEETKYGLNESTLEQILTLYQSGAFQNIRFKGLMGMASFSSNKLQIESEFIKLRTVFNEYKLLISDFNTLSMGMSDDYLLAISCGSTMVRVGSKIFK